VSVVIPSALSIAASDPTGGAGIVADLEVFTALGVHGLLAVTALTAQNSHTFTHLFSVEDKCLEQQLESITVDFKPRAVKIGLLSSFTQAEIIVKFISRLLPSPFVLWDPILKASVGASLVETKIMKEIISRLIPAVDMITPNLEEAAFLAGIILSGGGEERQDLPLRASAAIARFFDGHLLIKGGHGQGDMVENRLYLKGEEKQCLVSRRIPGSNVRGSGCRLAAAICALKARGYSRKEAVEKGCKYMEERFMHQFRPSEGLSYFSPLEILTSREIL